ESTRMNANNCSVPVDSRHTARRYDAACRPLGGQLWGPKSKRRWPRDPFARKIQPARVALVPQAV
ncbi:MAG: hypothetical protein KDB01_01905, partial [Planctomycetaceae bacterium]|nr:hypothetical protein [Planctomycetaceae bacterium]